MERRNHERAAVNLKAALLVDQAMPIGCRIRDVSSGGMLLQYESNDKAKTFHKGDTVVVRVSLKQDDERKVIPFSMTVRRVEENGIGVEFLQPQSQLMMLVEPYLLDKAEIRRVAANQGRGGITAENVASPISTSTGTRASRRRFAVKRARAQLAETMKAGREPDTDNNQPSTGQTPEGSSTGRKDNRRLFYVGLLSLVTAVGILLFDFGDGTRTEYRMSALESAINRQVNALTLLRARLSSMDTRTKELTELNTRVETLAVSFAALETRLAGAPQPASDKPAAETLTKSVPPTQPQSISNEGPWVINLVSLYDETAANLFTEKARTQGVRAETSQVAVKGKQVWRVQVSGFSTRDEASTYGDTSKEKLGLNSVWIFKKDQ